MAPPPPAIEAQAKLARVVNSFDLTVEAPLERAAVYFGPEGERKWAGEAWDPHFVYPQPARDIEGAVFTLEHGGRTTFWVNTMFDLRTGRIQYVVTAPDFMVTVIDLKLTREGPSRTGVHVTYTRTALSAEASEHVVAIGKSDAENGPHWGSAIASAIKSERQ